ncbi:hypothetical protein AGMMS4956_08650 [Bacteroidia bacterium]|nr:hypothetical protein AGMMS4956_08650 [Bacteroidia bacterium]
MKKLMTKKCGTSLLFLWLTTAAFAQNFVDDRDTLGLQDTLSTHTYPPLSRAGIALAEGAGINLAGGLIGRFILQLEWAEVTQSSIVYNLTHGFMWDNDHFVTNFFQHPYTGGMYFNAARSNGFTYWQSLPFAIVGSGLWEFFAENQPPSINDIIATPLGGMALGEVTHRLSLRVHNNSLRGWRRFGNELLAGIISPMDLLSRVVSGDAWKVRPQAHNNSDDPYGHLPCRVDFAIYNRFLTDIDRNQSRENVGLNVNVVYGDIFTAATRTPYDYFTFDAHLNLYGGQPLLSEMSIVGVLLGAGWESNNHAWTAGIFQHFDYYEARPIVAGGKNLYEFAEPASFGGGLLYQYQRESDARPLFCGSLYANFVFLGTSESDYYKAENRNYNMGNGYSIKFNAVYNFGKRWEAALGYKRYHIYTNKGYGSDDAEINGLPQDADLPFANVQGNKGSASVDLMHLNIGFQLTPAVKITAEQRFYYRQSHYNYLDDVTVLSTENRLKITYSR